MESERFDQLAKSWCRDSSRRHLLLRIGAATVAGTIAQLVVPNNGTAKRKHRRHKKAKPRSNEILAGVPDADGQPTENGDVGAEATRGFSLAAPWYSGPNAQSPTWKVINGYNGGKCHDKTSPCGKRPHDEYYALDLVPESCNAQTNFRCAGGKYVISPVRGRLLEDAFFDPGRGWGVKIVILDGADQPTGYVVHLYHLQNLRVTKKGAVVQPLQRLGDVFSPYQDAPDHLHVQVNNMAGDSQPLRIAGKLYYDRGSLQNQWRNQLIRNNTLYSGPNWGGDAATTFVGDVAALSRTNGGVGNDNTSSLRVNQGCTVTLFEHTNYIGRSRTFQDQGVSTLSGFDNIASSVRLVCP